jgi:hypothetical protein
MILRRNIRLLALFNFCLDFRLYGPVAILYFTQVAGSFALAMGVFSVAMLASSLLEVPTGILSDRMGRKLTVVCGAVCSVLSIVCYALGGSVAMLFLGAIFEGTARAFWSGNNDALLYDTLVELGEEAAYTDYAGRTSSMYQLALAISAVAGSVVAFFAPDGLVLLMWLSVIPQIGALIVSLQLVNPTPHQQTSGNIFAHLGTAFRNIMQNPRLKTLSAANILTFAIGEASFQFRATFTEMLVPVWALGVIRLLAHIGAASSFYFAGRIIRRFGELRLLVGGITFSLTVNLFSMLFPGILSPFLMASTSLLFGVNMTAIGGLMQREFTTEQRATMGSLTSFGGSLMFAVYALILGALADLIGVIPALIVSELFHYVTPYLFWRAFQHESRKAKVY